MAILIKTDGTQEVVNVPKKNQLEYLQKEVGGYVEMVAIRKHKGHTHMIVNEDGLRLRLPLNKEASVICNRPIVGNAILIKNNEVD